MSLKKYWPAYKALLKPLPIEGIPDLVFFRPLAYLLVQVLKKTPVTPNQVSFSALATGLAGAFSFSLGTRRSFLWAGLFYGVTVVLDCADGMLARLKNASSPLGRIIDGFVDYVNGFAIMLGFGLGLSKMSLDLPFNSWLLTAAAATSMAFHALFVDHYRTQFWIHALGKKDPVPRDLEQHRGIISARRDRGLSLGRRLFLGLSLFYHWIQGWLVRRERRFDSLEYYRRNKLTLRAWTMIEVTMHVLAMIASALFYNPRIFLVYSIVIANIWMLILAPLQYFINKKVKIREYDNSIGGLRSSRTEN